MRFPQTLALLLALGSFAFEAVAQVQRVTLWKQLRYLQTSPTAVALDSPQNSFFHANVDGVNIAGITPPTVSGPFNTAALGALHNNGVLVYHAGDGGWRWGTSGTDLATSSPANLETLFGNGIYTFTVNGVQVPLNLNGTAYPGQPVLTLSGGSWSGGAYVFDPAQPLTVTTSPFSEYGSHLNDVICVFLRGPGITVPNVATDCPGQRQRSSEVPGTNRMTYTVAANTLRAGEQYTLVTSFTAHVDSRSVAGLPNSSNTARYTTTTRIVVKATTPVFPMTVTANINANTATASAQIGFRPQDVGSVGSIFVFALAPATRVLSAQAEGVLKIGMAKNEAKADTPVACVLAQLNASGQMVAVTSANLAAYLTGVLSAQGASVSILNGVPTGNVSGATFFVGYGASSTAMLNSGANRAAVTVPGSLTCEPSAPEAGWWWNPLEDGRGFSLEVRGNNLFFASFLYDISGRSTWYVSSGPVSLEGALYNGDLLSASGGQTLGGPYVRFPTLASVGSMTLTFNNSRTGTLVWPGGAVPIQRFNIVADGVDRPDVEGVPESGWWWNEQEAGRGFFLEWQGNTLDIAGYMYDDNGNPVWYLTVGEIGGTASARSFSGTWWSYTGGQTLTGAWRQNARTNSNVAPLAITFSGPDTALMTLPNGRTTSLKRHRF